MIDVRTLAPALFALALAPPSLAHEATAPHTHGAPVIVMLAASALLAAIAWLGWSILLKRGQEKRHD